MSDENEGGISLADLLKGAMSGGDAKGSRRALTIDEQVEKLTRVAQDYHSRNPFKVGDLVTPRPDGILKWAGQPHIVVESWDTHFVRPEHLATCQGMDQGQDSMKMSDPNGYPMTNIRVAKCLGGEDAVGCFWGEHWQFEPWAPGMEGEGEQVAKPKVSVKVMGMNDMRERLAAAGSKKH